MKGKLLLSLGLLAIIGMPQASESSSEVRNIIAMFERLSSENQAIVREKILSQENVPVADSQAKLPEWVTKLWIKKPEELKRILVSGGEIRLNFEPSDYTQGKMEDLLRLISSGILKNTPTISINIDELSEQTANQVINLITQGSFSFLKTLGLKAESLSSDNKERLEQVLLHSCLTNLTNLYVPGLSFGFAKKMAETKDKRTNLALSSIHIEDKIPEDIRTTEYIFIATNINGVCIQNSTLSFKSICNRK